MRRWPPVALLALLVPLTACLPPFVGAPDAPKAVVVGDSLVFQAGYSGDIDRTFTSRAWQVSVAATIGGNIAIVAPSVIDAALALPQVVVVDTATSDVNAARIASDANRPRARAEIRDAMVQALDRLRSVPCVVVVTANERGITPGFAPEAEAYDAWLVPTVQGYPNATWIDWTAWSTGHPEWFDPEDGVHLTDAGKAALADVMERTGRTCGAW